MPNQVSSVKNYPHIRYLIKFAHLTYYRTTLLLALLLLIGIIITAKLFYMFILIFNLRG